MYRLYSWLSQASYFASIARNPRYLLTWGGVFLIVGLAAGLGFYVENWLLAAAVGLGLLLVLLLVVLAYITLSRREAERRERGVDEEEDEAVKARREMQAEREALRNLEKGFERSFEELRRSRLGGLYELPWLLVVGPPGSGKSSLLRESGLDLSSEYARLISDGPTPDCDWWLTNETIVLDTAGRLVESDEGASRRMWRLLLRLMRRARPKLPLEGLIVAVPVTHLLGRSARELEEDARRLRRRLNELKDVLRVDVPIYVFVTKADLIEGFVEVASQLPPSRLEEIFGWTNPERRFADAGQEVLEGWEAMRGRVDRFMPEMLMRESDPQRRRRLFDFSHELEDVGEALAVLLRRAFAPSVYDETPFMRGVYLVSARREGQTVSPRLERLGHDWARHAVADAGVQRGFFLRDAFREVVVGDQELALPTGRLGPLARRFILGTGLLVLLVMCVFWTIGFWNHRAGTNRLEADAEALISAAPSLPVTDVMRGRIESEEARAAGFFGGLGYRGLFHQALDRAKRTYVWAFGREFEDPSKANLLAAVRRYDDDSFEALANLAMDINWISMQADGEDAFRPQLFKYAPISRKAQDRDTFTAGYDAWVSWSSDVQRQQRVNRELELLRSAAATLLNMERLLRWSEIHVDTYPPVRYRDVRVPEPEDALLPEVPGAFTRRTWEALVRGLVDAVGRSGGASRTAVEEFRRNYVTRYDGGWREFLISTPTAYRSDPGVKESPYVELVRTLDENTRAELPREVEAPSWIQSLHEVRREEVREDVEGDVPPWLTYEGLLDQVHADVSAAQVSDKAALGVAIKVAQKEATSFRQALDQIRALVPSGRDPQAEEKLRRVLSMPVLDGFSAVMDTAIEAVDQRWAERIANRYGHGLSKAELEELYAPQTGALDKFIKTDIGPFYNEGRLVETLADRTMQLGPQFLAWLDQAERVQAALFGRGGPGQPEVTVVLDGVPSRVVGGGLVSRQDLILSCGADTQSWPYRQGTDRRRFEWSPRCQEVVLRAWVKDPLGGERELKPRKEWRGPLAFPLFFQDARPVSQSRYEWTLRYDDGSEIVVTYDLRSGGEIRDVVHRAPPPTVRE